jgi:hypothetical protein
MSGNATIIDDPIVGKIQITFENPDLLTQPALASRPVPDLPANLDKLSWKALDDLHKQHKAEGKEETKLMTRLYHVHELHGRFAALCRQKLHDIQVRGDARHIALRQSANAMEVHEQRDSSLKILASLYDGTSSHRDCAPMLASQQRCETPGPTNMAVLPSHAFITKKDLEVNFMEGAADAEKLATRLSGYCTFRGGPMARLPGLPL